MKIKTLFFVAFLAFLGCTPIAQLRMRYNLWTGRFPVPQMESMESLEPIKCRLETPYNLEERRQMFPFNKVKKVLAIAYENFEMKTYTLKDTLLDAEGKQTFVSRSVSASDCKSKKILKTWDIQGLGENKDTKYCATEIVELNPEQIDILSNLLFNFQLTHEPNIVTIIGCYTPRNSFLFLDEKEEVIAYVEMCFECRTIIYSFEKGDAKSLDNYCPQQRVALKGFLAKIGIRYGV